MGKHLTLNKRGVIMTKKIALIQMHIAAVLFGISGIFGNLIISDASILSFGRSIFAILAMTILSLHFRIIPWRIPLKAFYTLTLTGILLAAHWVSFFHAIKVGNIAVATLGFACFPACVALFEMFFFKEKITATEYSLLICVSAGLIMVTPSFDLNNEGTVGLIWGIISGTIYGASVVINRYSLKLTTGVQICWWQCFIVLIILFPFSFNQLNTVPKMDWLWIACLGLLCTGLSYYLFISSLTAINAKTASIIIALEPVYAIIGAWILFHEIPSIRTVVGGLIIIVAVIWAGLQKQTANNN